MSPAALKIGHIPAILWGEPSDWIYLYVHGKMGCKEEAIKFADVVCEMGWQVLSFDFPGHGERRRSRKGFRPQKILSEINSVWDFAEGKWKSIALCATGIGAWLSMLALKNQPVRKALFVSPVLDMHRMIKNMMQIEGITIEELRSNVRTSKRFGELLSWDFFQFVERKPILNWNCPTEILYSGDNRLIEEKTVCEFCHRFRCGLTTMENGDHWLHTNSQLKFLEKWVQQYGVKPVR